jgi:hypothetical protein
MGRVLREKIGTRPPLFLARLGAEQASQMGDDYVDDVSITASYTAKPLGSLGVPPSESPDLAQRAHLYRHAVIA